jgi:2,4-dienoyl-CoA reductase (NADPH2)
VTTLFSPIAIGAMALRNRLVMAPLTTDYANPDLSPSERLIDFLVARARGGVGLITVEACTIDSRHRETPRSLGLADDACVPAHRRLTDAVHAHGAKIQPQITHPGPDSLAPLLGGTPAVGPSIAVASVSGVACRALAVEEIDTIIEQYAAAARRAREAGYDGMELHAAHGYMLLGSFLSPWRNKRTDAYAGKSLAGRLALVLEVVRRMKAATGGDFPLTLRISGYERVPGGRDLDETARMAPALVDAGVDAFHVSGGVSDRLVTQIVRGAAWGAGHNVAAAHAVKRVVDVPVMVVGRINDPGFAVEVLRDGQADLIVMGRALLADPELPRKARAGRFGEIRRCISCEHCIDAMARGTMHCTVNAAAGREGAVSFAAAATPKRVLVVGGGPGGMEAARVAALRGHSVTLYERSHRLGGALVLAAAVHRENQYFLDYLATEIRRLPVSVRLGATVTPALVRRLAPDAVIVASGGRVVVPSIPGDALPHVVAAPALRAMVTGALVDGRATRLPAWRRRGLALAGPVLGRLFTAPRLRALSRMWMPLGRRVVIVGADLAAIELAEFLAERRRSVAVVDEGDKIAPEVGKKRRAEHMDRLDDLGVTVNIGVRCEEITRQGVVIRASPRHRSLVECDSVVLAGTLAPSAELFEALRAVVPEAYAVGDCTGLGLIRKATEEGLRAACAI